MELPMAFVEYPYIGLCIAEYLQLRLVSSPCSSVCVPGSR